MLGEVVLSPGLKRFYFVLVGALLFELLDDFFEVSYLRDGVSWLFMKYKGGLEVNMGGDQPFNCERYSFLVVNARVPADSSPRKLRRKPSTTSMTCLEESSIPSSASSADALAPISAAGGKNYH